MRWFKKALRCRDYLEESMQQFQIQSRELSAVYKFIRGIGMPMLAADRYWTRRLKISREKKRKVELMLQEADEVERCALKRT